MRESVTKLREFSGTRIVGYFLLGICLGGARARGQEPWESPAFSAEPSVLLQRASSQAAPEGAPDLVLFEDHQFQIQANGSAEHRWHIFYRILTPEGISGWDTVEQRWEPWHEERPSIRARVVTPDGAAHALDEKTIAESPAAEEAPDLYTDARILRAPLPAIAPGSIVEEEIDVREKFPKFAAGTVRHVYFGKAVRVSRTRLIIEAPDSLPFHYVARLLPDLRTERSQSKGRFRIKFDAGQLDPYTGAELLIPPDLPRSPHVAFSTGRSWQEVATGFNSIVESKLQKADLRNLLDGIPRGNASRDEVSLALIRRLHKEVRYTGIEFGESGFVPRTPAETLQRRYGDCKDKAALLVAMLRAEGIPAYLALLTPAPDEDVESDLPGLGSFNHAIVYAPGSPDLWIDATAEFARPEELPANDQGRLALVIRPETTGMIRTPESASADNREVETREIRLAELGPADVTETTETWGTVEESYRETYGTVDQKMLYDEFQKYMKSNYLAEKLDRVDFSEARDFSRRFKMRLESERASRGTTTASEAVVAIPLASIFARLPQAVKETEPSGGESSEAQEASRRHSDLVLPEASITEWHYHIVPPPGFRPRDLPPKESERLGAGLLTKEFSVAPDGAVLANFRFDTAKRRLTPDESSALRKQIQEVRTAEPILIYFEQIGESYLASGDVQGALREFNQLVTLHPKEALHHTQLARALLAAGAGEAAREEVRRALELEPNSPLAYESESWVLQHDLIGRRFRKGFDLKGAVAAYRKALELDPSDTLARGNLAILLEHNEQGVRYGPGARLDDAIQEYRGLGDALEGTGLTNNLLIALLQAGKYPEVADLYRKIPSTPERLQVYLAAIAASKGSAAAIEEAKKLIPDEEPRNRALVGAGDYLHGLRLYQPAADLMTAGAKNSPEAARVLARASIFRKTHRFEEIALSPDDPGSVVKEFFLSLMSPAYSQAKLFSLLDRNSREGMDQSDFAQFERIKRMLHNQFVRAGVSDEESSDLTMSNLMTTAEGDEAFGYRVRVQMISLTNSSTLVFFVIREDGRYRIAGFGNEPAPLGFQVLACLDRGDLAGARRWLDWVREEQTLPSGDDPLAGPPFARFWERGMAGDRDTVRTAAASLLAMETPEPASKPLAILHEGRERAGPGRGRVKFDLALAAAYTKARNYHDLLPVARELVKEFPESNYAFTLLEISEGGLKAWPECKSAAEDRLKRIPEDPAAIRSLALLAMRQGDFGESVKIYQQIVETGKAEAGDFNNLSWAKLEEGRVDDKAVQEAERSNLMSQNSVPSYLHTLASLYAEVGRGTEAREVMLEGLDQEGLEEPNSSSWYVFGRIAEQYGVCKAASADYLKVEAPKPEESLPDSTFVLAQHRLKNLGAACGKS